MTLQAHNSVEHVKHSHVLCLSLILCVGLRHPGGKTTTFSVLFGSLLTGELLCSVMGEDVIGLNIESCQSSFHSKGHVSLSTLYP